MGPPRLSLSVELSVFSACGMAAMNTIMPAMGGLFGFYAASKVIPVMYRWELIPGVASPEWHAKAARINYHHYDNGFVYSMYDTGEPITEMPAESQNKMMLKQKGGGWKLQSEM